MFVLQSVLRLYNVVTNTQIPGWNTDLNRQPSNTSPTYSGQQARSNADRMELRYEPRGNDREFIDAELHEELIWLEAAAVCDKYADLTARHSGAAQFKSGCVLADDVSDQELVSFQVGHDSDVDDWYSSDIETEMLKLEEQRYALAEAQVAFEVALQRMRPESASTDKILSTE